MQRGKRVVTHGAEEGGRHGGGPRTPKGKARAAQNAVKHGLYSNSLLPWEDRTEFQALHDDIIRELGEEASRLERELAHQVAVLVWRLRRAAAAEVGVLMRSPSVNPDLGDSRLMNASAFFDQAATLERLGAQEQRLHRAMLKNVAVLLDLRAGRSCLGTNGAKP